MVTQNASEKRQARHDRGVQRAGRAGLGELPPLLYVDWAYVHAEALLEAQIQGRELRGPAPASPGSRPGLPASTSSTYTSRERYAVCPGRADQQHWQSTAEGKTGKVAYRMEWKPWLSARPARFDDRCLGKEQTHRTIAVGQCIRSCRLAAGRWRPKPSRRTCTATQRHRGHAKRVGPGIRTARAALSRPGQGATPELT